MYAGHIVETAPVVRLFSEPLHPYTRGLIASVPGIEAAGNVLSGMPLRGMLRRDELPPGCPFAPRCHYVGENCARHRQVPETVHADHLVACERWHDIAGIRTVESRPAARPGTPSSEPVLEVKDLTIVYGQHKGLRVPFRQPRLTAAASAISFSIRQGETLALVGESGSGKSTITRAISGLLSPTEGAIFFKRDTLPGLSGARSPEQRRRIQLIFQNPGASLNPRASIASILTRPLRQFFDLDSSEIEHKIEAALNAVQLDPTYVSRFPSQLSGGERQRVAIARALSAEPELLLCDEILSELDVSVQANIVNLLRRLRREYRVAMLFISHDLAVVRTLADTVAVMFGSQIMQVGPSAHVFAPPFHPYTYQLLMAVPRLGGSVKRARSHILPPRTASRGACAFAGRCQWQIGEICESVAPPWRHTSSGVAIRCHLNLDELTARAAQDGDAQDGPSADGHQGAAFSPNPPRPS